MDKMLCNYLASIFYDFGSFFEQERNFKFSLFIFSKFPIFKCEIYRFFMMKFLNTMPDF